MTRQALLIQDWATATRPQQADQANPRSEPVFWVDVIGYGNRLPIEEQWWQTLAEMVAAACHETGVPMKCPLPFVSYQDGTGPWEHRQPPTQWPVMSGVVGPQHLPLSGSGAPGDMSRLAQLLELYADLKPPPIMEIQQALQAAGFYKGQLTGEADEGTALAVQELLDEYGRRDRVGHAQASQVEQLSAMAEAAKSDGVLLDDVADAIERIRSMLSHRTTG